MPGAGEIPSGGEAKGAVGIDIARDDGGIAGGIVFGDEVFVGKLAVQFLDDVFEGVLLDGLCGVEAEAVDAVVAEKEAGIVEDELTDLRLPESEAFTPRGVVAVHKVDAAFDSLLPAVYFNGVTSVVTVIAPVAIFTIAGVGVDDVKDDGEAFRVSSVDQLDEFGDSFGGIGGVDVGNCVEIRWAI